MKKLLALIAAAVLAVNVQAGEYPDISITDLEKAIKSGKVAVIDVNGKKSFTKRGHIPGAVSFYEEDQETKKRIVNKEGMKKYLSKFGKDTLVVAYCSGPRCNAYTNGAKHAKSLGFKNVKHLSVGITGWIENKRKVEKN